MTTVRRALLAVRSSPVTCTYVLVLLLTSIIRRIIDPRTAVALLHASSTDVVHLEHDPVQSMLAAAMLVAGAPWLPWAIVILACVAPLERVLGAGRTAVIFVSGHVLATLLTEVPIALSIEAGWLPHSAAYRLDFGVSYGVATCIIALAGIARGRARVAVLTLTVIALVTSIVLDPDMTEAGHGVACLVGFGWWWWLASRGLLGARNAGGLWLSARARPPEEPPENHQLTFPSGAGTIT